MKTLPWLCLLLSVCGVADAQTYQRRVRRPDSAAEAQRLLFGAQGLPALTRPADRWNVPRYRPHPRTVGHPSSNRLPLPALDRYASTEPTLPPLLDPVPSLRPT